MAGGLHDERFVDDEPRRFEAGVEVAVGPLLGGWSHRQPASRRSGEVGLGPLQRLQRRTAAGARTPPARPAAPETRRFLPFVRWRRLAADSRPDRRQTATAPDRRRSLR